LVKVADTPETDQLLLIATGKYIGEGFDEPRLDTLFLAMPIAWKGTLQQYAGRLHRLHDSKKEVLIYDYVDVNIRVLEKRKASFRVWLNRLQSPM
jgi:superfamily II DNA or RNA helicase